MRIKWDEIPAVGLSFSVDEDSWVPGNDVICQGQGVCTVTLKKEGKRVLFLGSLSLPLVFECDRCLDSFTYVLAEEFELVFELLANEKEGDIVSEYLCKSCDLDVVYLGSRLWMFFPCLRSRCIFACRRKDSAGTSVWDCV